MFKHIYLNFDIWVYTSSPAQHALLDLVTTHVVQQPQVSNHVFFLTTYADLSLIISLPMQHFKRLIGIKGVLDILRSYYWYTDRPGKSYLDRSNQDRDGNTGENHKKKRRLTADEVKCTRLVIHRKHFMAFVSSRSQACGNVCFRGSKCLFKLEKQQAIKQR